MLLGTFFILGGMGWLCTYDIHTCNFGGGRGCTQKFNFEAVKTGLIKKFRKLHTTFLNSASCVYRKNVAVNLYWEFGSGFKKRHILWHLYYFLIHYCGSRIQLPLFCGVFQQSSVIRISPLAD